MQLIRQTALYARGCAVVALLSVGLCAATPPVHDGTRLQAGAGFGQYEYLSGGCDSPVELREAAELRMHFRAERFWARLGINVVFELMLAAFLDQRRRLLDDESTPGAELRPEATWAMDAPFTAIRIGYHREHFGLELGALLFTYLPFVSANGWLGHRLVHGWVGLNDSPLRWRARPPNPIWPLSFGVGHVTEDRRLSLGYQSDGMALEGHFRWPSKKGPGLWIGARLNFAGAKSWGTLLYVGHDFGGRP